MSRGKLIHILHGDDMVLWEFYNTMEKLFNKYPNIGAAYCRFHFIDSISNINYTAPLEIINSGIFEYFFKKISQQSILQTPSIVVHREVYEKNGTFDQRFKYTEAWEMWQRIGSIYQVAYSPKVLALYRHNRSNNNTHKTIVSGKSIEDLLSVYKLIKENTKNRIADVDAALRKNLFFLLKHQIP